jgi:hypothetical protein
VWHTTNGGASWRTAGKIANAELNDVVRVDANTWWTVGGRGSAASTGNAGLSWAASDTGTRRALNGLATDGTTVWAFGDAGAILAHSPITNVPSPITTVTRWPAPWVHNPRDVLITCQKAGSAGAETLYIWETFGQGEPTTLQLSGHRVGADTQRFGFPMILDPSGHTLDGPHQLQVWGVDNRGNEQWPHTTRLVNIDTRKPVVKAYASTGRRGGRATLKYKVVEQGFFRTKAELVKLKVLDRHGKTLKLVRLKNRIVNKKLRYVFMCRLRKGMYRFRVTCIDGAGNTQVKPAVGKLRVK